ncbi:MAG: NAD+ synthase [Phycisphaerales bacterium]|nr:NAD+ synthase [Phycisphaerales bacterium]
MKLGLVQFNPTVGDLRGNADAMIAWVERAEAQRCDVVVFPELALTGYPPRDLLVQGGFMQAVVRECERIASAAGPALTVVFGTPLPVDPKNIDAHRLHNSLLVARDGKVITYYDKRLLPTYDVFDEDRYFEPGEQGRVIEVHARDGSGVTRVGLSICEDLWRGEDVGFAARYLAMADPLSELVRPRDGSAGATVIVNPSASPFRLGTGVRHRELLRRHAMAHGVYVAAVNQVGANDELVFDGHAAAFDPRGALIAAGSGFVEDLVVVDLPASDGDASRVSVASIVDPLLSTERCELLFEALKVGVRDYCRKTGFKRCVLGLSGGIDSAVVAVLATAALGPQNILGLSMPSRYSSQGSRDDAMALAQSLGIGYETVEIEPVFGAMLGALGPVFAGAAADVTEENLQSRIRGSVLMGVSNKQGRLLLTTGNKSEVAVGYCTLYGDMNGGLAVISDVYKTLVYELSRWMNEHWQELGISGLSGPPIPVSSITKPPSAELRPNQTDQDSLPAYEVLDEIVERYVERRQSAAEIVSAMLSSGASGAKVIDEAGVRRVIRLIDLSEFKRKQAAPGLKVTSVAFGTGRRMPIAQGWRADRE